MMNDVVNMKFGLFALLKLLDRYQGGELHDEFAAIAGLLNLELPVLPPDGEDETDGEAQSQQDRILQFLAAQPGPVGLSKIVAELNAKRWTVTSTLWRLHRKGSIEHPSHDAWQVRKPG